MDKKNTLDESLMWDMFGTTMESGIPVLMALNLVRDTFPAYKEEIQHLHDVIREGDSCAIALNKYKDSFHPLTIPLIDVGEETGALPEMLFKCSEIAKKNNSNESTLWYSLGTLTDAGMPILRSMRIAKKAFPNYDVELANIAESIESGSTITESLEAKPCSFNPLVKYIIERGEYSGNLEGGFFRASNLVEYKENVDESIFYNPEQKDKLTFFKYAGCLLDEGIPLTRGLKIISDAVDEPSLTYHGWNSDSGILIPYEHKMDLKEGIGDVALRLHESKLLDIDHKKITDIKEKHRSSFFKNKDLVIKKDLAYFRNIVKQGKKMDNPLFLITESSSFEDVINTINKEEIITYFPFSSRLDNEFLLRVLDYSA